MCKRVFAVKVTIIAACVLLLLGGIGVFIWARNRVPLYTQSANLQKLCNVWGFTKYTHMSFILGLRCWDEELLSLIPIVQFADPHDVNYILYDWFTGLGDDGYDLNWAAYRTQLLESFEDYSDLYNIVVNFFNERSEFDWQDIWELEKELSFLYSGYEMTLRRMANLNWINEDYLGLPLYSVLARFEKIQVTNRANAPFIPAYDGNNFMNEPEHANFCYTNNSYRLLGLFRLWNAVKYYFPYLDIIDECWNELLLSYIPKMLEGSDRHSYKLTLASLASNLHDAHIFFWGNNMNAAFENLGELFGYMFGNYIAPVRLTEAEGHLVVAFVMPRRRNNPLLQGDVILRLNGKDINEVTNAMLQYLPYPNREKALAYLTLNNIVLRQHSNAAPMQVEVLRNGINLELYVDPVLITHGLTWPPVPEKSHILLENNIGLINPGGIVQEEMFHTTELRGIMSDFADTSGLIIDLRQFPGGFIIYELAEYLLDELSNFVIISRPAMFAPGLFVDETRLYSGPGGTVNIMRRHGIPYDLDELPDRFFFYEHNIVILMNAETISQAEFTVMALRSGPNVTVMGSNSIGANGNVTTLPLPDGISMFFTGRGIFTPCGNQTQRVGLSPDIVVTPTIVGIRDGRDELMEAAVQFLLGQLGYEVCCCETVFPENDLPPVCSNEED